jgi:hypothetical protein
LQSLEALRGYYSSLSVAKFPGSSREDRDKSLLKSLGLLKQQMCYLMDFHHQLDGTVVTPDSFSTVMINPAVKEYAEFDRYPDLRGKSIMPSGILPDQFGAESEIESPPTETIADRPSQKDQEQSDATYRLIASKSEQLFEEFVSGIHPDHKTEIAPDNTVELQEDEMDQEDDQDFDEEYEKYKQTEDEDEDDDDNLTDEEYLEKMKSITVYRTSTIVEKP